MDKQYIEQFDVSRRYLNGTLSPEQRIEFEEYILDKPEMIEQLELDRAILAGLKALPEKAQNDPFWRPVYSHMLATAASVALVAVLLFDVGQGPIEQGPGAASPEIVYLETFRSQDLRTQVTFNEDAGVSYLVAAVPSDDRQIFTIALQSDGDNAVSAVLAESMANSEGDLVITLDKAKIKPGMYSVVVSNAANETIKRYRIEIVH